MPYFTNAKNPNSFFWTTVQHLPAAFVSHGLIKAAEKIAESHSGKSGELNQYNKSNARNYRFKP